MSGFGSSADLTVPHLPLTTLATGALAGLPAGGTAPGDPLIEWLEGLIGPGGTGPTFPMPPAG